MTSYDPVKHHRRSIRLAGYDYSQDGAYFITICTLDRKCLFGEVMNGIMQMNEFGQIVSDEWTRSADIRKEIELDAFVVMPNHIHGIVIIRRGVRPDAPTPPVDPMPPVAPTRPDASTGSGKQTLGSFVAGFKSAVTKRINQLRGTPGTPVWQRNYYEHIIRNDIEWMRVRDYIAANPINWVKDKENPQIKKTHKSRYQEIENA